MADKTGGKEESNKNKKGLFMLLRVSQARPFLLIASLGLVLFRSPASAMTYTTNFPSLENPISEGGHWKNGAADGTDWTNCRTKPGLVFGTESGAGRNQYDDSTCILTGTWGPLQTIQATVFSQNQTDLCFQEVELRLHSTMTAHSSTGYEVLFRAYHPGGYATIVRWNGALGNFTYLNQKPNSKYKGIQTGDVVKATIDGNGLIIGYVNSVEVIRAADTTYANGNPGVGFWLLLRRGQGRGTNADYGFSALTATDGLKIGGRENIGERRVAIRTSPCHSHAAAGVAELSVLMPWFVFVFAKRRLPFADSRRISSEGDRLALLKPPNGFSVSASQESPVPLSLLKGHGDGVRLLR